MNLAGKTTKCAPMLVKQTTAAAHLKQMIWTVLINSGDNAAASGK